MTNQHGPRNEDEALGDELKAHHAVMVGDLDRLSAALAGAAGSGQDAARAKRELEQWVAEILVPHAEEEEATTYRAAGELPAGALLIRSMLAEHELIRLMARHVSEAEDTVAAAAFARALFDILDSHQRKENDIILPLLVATDTVSLTEIMAGAHGHTRDHDHGHGHEADEGAA